MFVLGGKNARSVQVRRKMMIFHGIKRKKKRTICWQKRRIQRLVLRENNRTGTQRPTFLTSSDMPRWDRAGKKRSAHEP